MKRLDPRQMSARDRHILLHQMFDELLAAYLSQSKDKPPHKKKKRAPGAGRPPRLVKCPNCGKQFGVRDFRKHLTDCRG